MNYRLVKAARGRHIGKATTVDKPFYNSIQTSLDVAPYAWLRRQRIERARTQLHDPNLDLTQIGII
jgi:hypothetical protein